ncbi:holotricin-3-like [Penaeus monodon]|uniref:holotricin-3-like n=1 Tax=Penaeus monodon TaxID=6687 RepID=UPI0018A7C185|nr:holotricin-3-like [Penaeus monodon]
MTLKAVFIAAFVTLLVTCVAAGPLAEPGYGHGGHGGYGHGGHGGYGHGGHGGYGHGGHGGYGHGGHGGHGHGGHGGYGHGGHGGYGWLRSDPMIRNDPFIFPIAYILSSYKKLRKVIYHTNNQAELEILRLCTAPR